MDTLESPPLAAVRPAVPPPAAGPGPRTGPRLAVAGLVLLAAAALAAPGSLVAMTPAQYAPLHAGLELFAVAFAFMVFMVGWSAPAAQRSRGFTTFGNAFLAVALLDALHALTYPGMPGLLGPNGADRSLALWLAARAATATALVVLALERRSPVAADASRGRALALWAGLALATAALVFGGERHLPVLLDPRSGLTATKVAVEGALVVAFAVAALLLARRGGRDEDAWLAAASWACVVSEVLFSSYRQVSDVANLAGHLVKAAAFMMLWRAASAIAIDAPRRALAASEARFRNLARLTADWYWEQDENLRFTRIEGDLTSRTGLPESQYLGRTRREALGDRLREFDWEAHDRLLAARRPFRDMLLEMALPAGGTRFLSVSGEPVFDAGGRFAGYRGAGKDVTDRVRLERALQDSEERLRAAVEGGGHSTWDIDLRTGKSHFWGDLPRHLGYGDLHPGLDELDRYLHPDDVAGALEARRRHFRGETERLDAEFRLRRRDGTWAWVLASGRVIERSPSGRARRMVGTLTDISERKSIERQLAESNQRFLAVFERSAIALALVEQETGRFLDVNAANEALTGYGAAECIGRTSAQMGYWVNEEERERAWESLRRDGRLAGFVCRQRSRDGTVRELQLFAEVIHLGGRSVILSQKVDVTTQRAAERRLVESEEWMRALFERSPLASVVIDIEDRTIVDANAVFTTFLGRERGAVIGRTGAELGLWPDEDDRSRMYQALRSKGRFQRLEVRVRARDGAIAETLLFGEVLSRGGRPLLVVQAVDLTQRLQAERELARVNAGLERRVEERTRELRASNEELEAFSYTVAHDLRAPLRAIDGYSHLLGEAAAAGDAAEVPGLLAKVRRNVTGMERLIDGLLHYARLGRQEVQRMPVDMARLAAEARLTLADQFPGTAVEIGPMPPARGDPELLRQVWTNLLANACKFSAGVPSPRVRAGAEPADGGTTYFVSDNGAGFDMRFADKLFGMFQRLHTEREFAGSGVGLAVVARIVERHGGRVAAEGAPGRGATFRFYVPDA